MRRSGRVAGVALGLLFAWEAGATTLSEDLALLIPPMPEGPRNDPDPGWQGASEIRLAALGSIHLYQVLLSSQGGRACSFTPSCSHFAQEAIARFGTRGVLLASDRIQRCHPLGDGSHPVDPASGRRIDPVDAYEPGDRSFARMRGLSLRAPAPPEALSPPSRVDGGSSAGVPDSCSLMRCFADHLMKEEDWLRAATEYRRSLLCEPDVETADTLTLRLGVCLRRGGEPDRAVDALRRMLDGAGRKDLSRVAVREIALAYYGSGRPGEGARFLEKLRADDPSLFLASGGPHLLGVGSLFQGAWAEAHEAFRVGAADASWPGEAALRDLDAISLQGMRLDRKSPALAACLSAVVPGAGKAYAGRFRDGLYSLLTVGVTLWQSIDGFSDGGADSGRGWIYGTLSTGFYMGNVYGSAVAARIRNERSEVDLQERAAAAAFEAGSP